ncbi:MAG: hypothetical protein AAF800_04445 [Planctomycetota bacterium]
MSGQATETVQPSQTLTNPVDRTFLEHRAKLLDLAAFLDRCDRFGPAAADDPRVVALREALLLLTDGRDERARRVLEWLSDSTEELRDTAPPAPACGVPVDPQEMR